MDEKSKINAITEEECMVLLLPTKHLTPLLNKYPELYGFFYKQFSSKKSELIDFVSITTHEFKSPITIIKSLLDILKMNSIMKTNDSLDSLFEKYLTRIENEVDKLLTIMDNSEILEQLNKDDVLYHTKPIDILGLFLNVLERYNEILYSDRKIMVKVNKTPKPIHIDPNLMGQVFDNLISNAFKYSEGSKTPEIIFSFENNKVEITITDYGIGIPKEAIEKISTPYFRADNTRNIKGTGIGLNIVKKILDLHKADFSIESTINEGTTIKLTIYEIQPTSSSLN